MKGSLVAIATLTGMTGLLLSSCVSTSAGNSDDSTPPSSLAAVDSSSSVSQLAVYCESYQQTGRSIDSWRYQESIADAEFDSEVEEAEFHAKAKELVELLIEECGNDFTNRMGTNIDVIAGFTGATMRDIVTTTSELTDGGILRYEPIHRSKDVVVALANGWGLPQLSPSRESQIESNVSALRTRIGSDRSHGVTCRNAVAGTICELSLTNGSLVNILVQVDHSLITGVYDLDLDVSTPEGQLAAWGHTETLGTGFIGDVEFASGSKGRVVNVAANDSLKVRSSPGRDNPVVQQLAPDFSDVEVIAESTQRVGSSTWVKIFQPSPPGWLEEQEATGDGGPYDYGTGWVNAMYLEYSEE